MKIKGSYLLLIISVCAQVANSTSVNGFIEQQNFDNSLLIKNVTQVQNETRVKLLKRITPIMFTKPFSDNDTCSDSQDDFPNFFTPEQRKQGAIVVSFLVGIYCFTLLAIVCDEYFLPSVERICETLNLSQDVAAATFMAMATSAPELFVNIIGTFITESDIGIGTVVGSSMFNTLGVGALGSLAASSPIQVDWWPVTRDCTLYLAAILLLVIMTWDGLIFWYEGLILFIAYFIYFVVMFNNKRISKKVKKLAERFSSKRNASTEDLAKAEVSEDSDEGKPSDIYYIENPRNSFTEYEKSKENNVEGSNNTKDDKPNGISSSVICNVEEPIPYTEIEENDNSKETEEKKKDSKRPKLFRMPKGSCLKKFFFFYAWPIKLLLFCTVPNPKVSPKLFPITFIMCIVFIGANSYIISWMISVIGHTFEIPDAILGLTFLAAGGCLPEAMSLVIMSRKGDGGMGVSNALGANTMNILLSLGLPWFVKTLLLTGSGSAFIEITSGSLEYTILGLMVVAIALVVILYFNDFKLSRRTGVILLVVYLCFLSAAITAEMLLFDTPDC